MDEKSAKTKRRARNLLIDVITLFVIIIVAVFVLILLGQRDSGTSDTSVTLKIVGLHCERSGVDNQYFAKTNPTSGQHSVSANFNGGELVDLMYSYAAQYSGQVNLEQITTSVHAAFDTDSGNNTGNRYVHQDDVWTESFSTIASENTVKMSIYSAANNLKASVSYVFDLDNSETFPKTLKAVQEAYETKGYTCEIKE